MKQRLHSSMAEIDVLTRIELEESLHKGLDTAIRSKYLGIDSARFPVTNLQGNGGTLNLGAIGASDGYIGPEQGDVWLVRRINVASSVFTDTAKYILFRGSTPSDPASYTSRYLLDGMVTIPGASTMSAPAVPASTVAAQNTTNQTYTVVVSGGTATSTSVNGIVVGAGDGTYSVPAYGSIAVTYSVAPTWTWTATQIAYGSAIGQNVGIAYNPGNKALLLQPGEQIYAQVFGSLAANTYSLSGEAIRCPAEMKGKLLG